MSEKDEDITPFECSNVATMPVAGSATLVCVCLDSSHWFTLWRWVVNYKEEMSEGEERECR